MFVQLNFYYYVGVRSFRELPRICMVSNSEPDGHLETFLFPSVAKLVDLTDLTESILFYFFALVNWFDGL